jgi:response regulator RpfG family c-di-GMP phosphodiesterase
MPGRDTPAPALSVKTNAKILFPDEPPRAFATNTSVAFWSANSHGSTRPHSNDSRPGPQKPKSALIYVVDDMPCLTELYTLVLEASGHRVKPFTNRHTALASLKEEHEKPTLLITDFRNASMHTDRFLQECIVVHPQLRILMATGFGYRNQWFSSITPDRFLQKPFTPEQLQQEVRAALAEEVSR